jgi:hypothetical protein
MQNPNHRYFYEEVGEIAFIFLLNLFHFNLDARRYMANAVFNGVYKPLEERQGDLAQIDDESRRKLLDLATLDILSKVFMALEDLGKLLLTLHKPLHQLPSLILGATQKDSLLAIKRHADKPAVELFHIFPFVEPKEYDLSDEQARALNDYYLRSATVAKKMLAFLADFIERHAWAYNKYKHGIPVILALGGERPAEGIDGTVPIFTDAKDLSKARFILTGRLVAEKLVGVAGSVVDLSKALVERRLQMAELGGLPPPLLCHGRDMGDTTSYEAWEFGQVKKESEQILTLVLNQTLGQLRRTKIEATLNVRIDNQKLKDLVSFYLRDWRIA